MNAAPENVTSRRHSTALPPCVVFEDEHLLVVHKPAGWNTHSPAPYAGEGLYDWLRHREPRWASLAIVHRLDKETSGVLVFGRTPLANRALTAQFAGREVRKRYRLATDRAVARDEFRVISQIVRAGERYVSRPGDSGAERAETHFRVVERASGRTWLEAEPVTGRTHQIRVHAAEEGIPIFGDALYGGTPAGRVWLHAELLGFRHPESGADISFQAPADFEAPTAAALRGSFIAPGETDAFRLLHGAADATPGWYLDRLDRWLLSQSGEPASSLPTAVSAALGDRSLYHRLLRRNIRETATAEASPKLVQGRAAPDRFVIRENGVRFELSFAEGASVGLFLDQRDNRRRFLVNHVAAGFPLLAGGVSGRPVLNCFAYTCGFSVCAALAGARTTSLDLSRKYLDWGRRNFVLNDLDPAAHDFIHGDVFDWLRRLAKKGRRFDAVLLDPPTFSRSKEHGDFRAEADFGELAAAALPVLAPGGVLFASTNAARLEPADFLEAVRGAVRAAKRRVAAEHFVPQPPDFPITRGEPAHLKTVWLRVD